MRETMNREGGVEDMERLTGRNEHGEIIAVSGSIHDFGVFTPVLHELEVTVLLTREEAEASMAGLAERKAGNND